MFFLQCRASCYSNISCGINVPDIKVLEGKSFSHFTAPITRRSIINFGIRLYGVDYTIHLSRCFTIFIDCYDFSVCCTSA